MTNGVSSSGVSSPLVRGLTLPSAPTHDEVRVAGQARRPRRPSLSPLSAITGVGQFSRCEPRRRRRVRVGCSLAGRRRRTTSRSAGIWPDAIHFDEHRHLALAVRAPVGDEHDAASACRRPGDRDGRAVEQRLAGRASGAAVPTPGSAAGASGMLRQRRARRPATGLRLRSGAAVAAARRAGDDHGDHDGQRRPRRRPRSPRSGPVPRLRLGGGRRRAWRRRLLGGVDGGMRVSSPGGASVSERR